MRLQVNFNKTCEIEDFSDPDLAALIREVASYKLERFPDLPAGVEHRKDWEIAMAVRALREHGALGPDARLLGVAAGTEDTLFYLTRHAGQVFATDIYANAGEWLPMAPLSMLIEPAAVAPYGFDVNRLVVQHMDARALRYPDNTFDGVFSSGSIEHVGELSDVANVAYEMGRVLKPGGVMSISTEIRLDGPPGGIGWPGSTLLFPPGDLLRYVVEASGLKLVDDLQTEVSDATLETSRDLVKAIAEYQDRSAAGEPEYASWPFPYVAMSHEGYTWTSVHLTLVKTDRYPEVDNAWAKPRQARIDAISDENRSILGTDKADLLAEVDAWKHAHKGLQVERVQLEAERDAWQQAHHDVLIERVGLMAERDNLAVAHQNLVTNREDLLTAIAQRDSVNQTLRDERDRLRTELTALTATRTFRLRAWALQHLPAVQARLRSKADGMRRDDPGGS